jgi:hypothetical protein
MPATARTHDADVSHAACASPFLHGESVRATSSGVQRGLAALDDFPARAERPTGLRRDSAQWPLARRRRREIYRVVPRAGVTMTRPARKKRVESRARPTLRLLRGTLLDRPDVERDPIDRAFARFDRELDAAPSYEQHAAALALTLLADANGGVQLIALDDDVILALVRRARQYNRRIDALLHEERSRPVPQLVWRRD